MLKIYFFVKNLFQSKFIKWIMNEGYFNWPLYFLLIVAPSCLLVFINYEEISSIENGPKGVFLAAFTAPLMLHFVFKIFSINTNLVIFFGFIIISLLSLIKFLFG